MKPKLYKKQNSSSFSSLAPIATTITASSPAASLIGAMSRTIFVCFAFPQLGPASPVALVFTFAGKSNRRGTGNFAASKTVAAVTGPSGNHGQPTLVSCFVDVHPPAGPTDLGGVSRALLIAGALLGQVLLGRRCVPAEALICVLDPSVGVLMTLALLDAVLRRVRVRLAKLDWKNPASTILDALAVPFWALLCKSKRLQAKVRHLLVWPFCEEDVKRSQL